jgi:hypothetical protein
MTMLFRSPYRSAVAASANDWIMSNGTQMPCIDQALTDKRARRGWERRHFVRVVRSDQSLRGVRQPFERRPEHLVLQDLLMVSLLALPQFVILLIMGVVGSIVLGCDS